MLRELRKAEKSRAAFYKINLSAFKFRCLDGLIQTRVLTNLRLRTTTKLFYNIVFCQSHRSSFAFDHSDVLFVSFVNMKNMRRRFFVMENFLVDLLTVKRPSLKGIYFWNSIWRSSVDSSVGSLRKTVAASFLVC